VALVADSVDPAQADMVVVLGSVDHQEDQATVLAAQAVDQVADLVVTLYPLVDLGDQATVQAA